MWGNEEIIDSSNRCALSPLWGVPEGEPLAYGLSHLSRVSFDN